MTNTDQPTPDATDGTGVDDLDFDALDDLGSLHQLGVPAGLWSADPVPPITLPLDLVFDDEPEFVVVEPGRAAALHAAGIPWDLVHLVGAEEDPASAAAALRRRLHSFDNEHAPNASGSPEPSVISPAARWLRRMLDRRLREHPTVDADTVNVALRLGDMHAASNDPGEALSVYYDIFERLTVADQAEANRVAERVGAVISHTGPETSRQIADDLAARLSSTAADPASSLQLYENMITSAKRDMSEMSLLQDGIDSVCQITDRDLNRDAAAELEDAALSSGAAAFVRLSDMGPGGNSGDLFEMLFSALLDTSLGSFKVVDGSRGKKHLRKFAHHCIVTSPLPNGATHAEHVRALLDTPLMSRDGMRVRDVMSGIGAFVEDSAVLLEEWNRQEGLNERDIVINCPLFLRNREAPNLSNAGQLSPSRLGSLVVTSLGWGGAADVGSILAEDWRWGYAAANDAQRLLAFGDWTEDPNGRRRQSEDARSLLRTTTTLLDALPNLPRRVCVLDEPRGAIEALAARSSIGSPKQPVAVIAITMNERRIRWVAQHMLSYGGSAKPSKRDVQIRTAELLATQWRLQEVVEGCRSEHTPVLVIDMDDHLEDGYAEKTGNDPVDEDFDCFYSTAQKLRVLLDQLAANLPVSMQAESR